MKALPLQRRTVALVAVLLPEWLRITQGYGSMPAFSHKLERGDVELLVDYVLELEAH